MSELAILNCASSSKYETQPAKKHLCQELNFDHAQ